MRLLRRVAGAVILTAAIAGLAVASGTGGAAPAPGTLAQRPVEQPTGAARRDQVATLTAALGRIQRRIAAGRPQWGDLDLRDVYAYHVDALWKRGINGAGTAVAVLEGWDDPNAQALLDRLDDEIGLPHTTVTTIYPAGTLPARCPAGMVKLGSYGSCAAWPGELDLDIEAVHLLAPYAKIVVAATPSDTEVTGDPSSEVAMPEMVKAMEYVSRHRLANVVSVSDGSSETDYRNGAPEIHAQDVGPLTAAAAGVPIANATGDCGVTQNLTTATRQCGTVSPGPASATWADSPWVTAVGGNAPQRALPCPPCTGPDASAGFPLDPIEGAGLSALYPRPDYQDGVAKITGSAQRALPDITMDSADGTSEAAPLFAGILALATQVKGSNLGPINHLLYEQLGRSPARNGLVDVVSGNNTFGPVPGYQASTGYDVASGWGTVDASRFVPALADAAADGNPMTTQAVRALAAVRGALSITPGGPLGPLQQVVVQSHGFLPGHPVVITLDGRPLARTTATTSGTVSYALTPQRRALTPGPHRIDVHSLLLDQSAKFTVTA